MSGSFCNPMGCSLPGSSVHGISQTRILEWIAISLSREIFLTQGSNPCLLHLLHCQADSLSQSHLGSPSEHHASKNQWIKALKWNGIVDIYMKKSRHGRIPLCKIKCVCMHFICLTKFIFTADYLRIVLLDLPLMVQPHQHPTPKEPMATCCRVPKSHTAPLFLK